LIVLALLEIVCAILIGILSKNYDKELAPLFLLFVGILYLIFALVRLLHLKNYPGTIAEELDSERKLTSLQKDTYRLNTLSDVHVENMKNLNTQTCKLEEDDGLLCDIGISDNLEKLLKPLIDKGYYLLNTEKGVDYTYGIYLSGYKALEKGTLDHGVVPISDGLNIKSTLIKELFDKQELEPEKQQIQNALKLCLSTKKFRTDKISISDVDYLQISSPMYEACREDDDKYLLGSLFIICPYKELANPKDIETQLKIFNRIIANWMYSYNSCITGKKKQRLDGKS
jgi:hypothetical protein